MTRRPWRAVWSLALLAACSAPGAGLPPPQPGVVTVLPGSGMLDARLLRPGVSSYRWVMERGGEAVPAGSVTDSLSATVHEGRPALARTQVARRGNTGLVDRSISLVRSLAPRSHRSQQPRRTVALDFDGRRVTGSVAEAGGQPVPFDTTVAVPVFDAANLDLLVRALPLREGLAARFPVFDRDNGGLLWYSVRVAGTDRLDAGEAWRVEAQMGGTRSILWVDRATRALARMEAEIQPGVVLRQLPVQ
ncbi:MAG TPA: hypothetical protein VF263_09185 [Longimicrobiaceae bacterium]